MTNNKYKIIGKNLKDKHKKKIQQLTNNLKPIFYVYTIGIVNWGNIDDEYQNIIGHWNNYIRLNILNSIPENFYISILHYDPSIESVDAKKVRIRRYINKNLKDNHPRIISSRFFEKYFNYQNIGRPYIIIDFSNVYSHFGNKGKVIIHDEEIELNVLRIGWWTINVDIGNLFRIEDDGRVITFRDQLINKGINHLELEREPMDYIQKILFNSIKINIENKIEKNFESVAYHKLLKAGIDEIFEIERYNMLTEYGLYILRQIFIYLWNDKINLDQLIVNIPDDFISNNWNDLYIDFKAKLAEP